VGLSGAHDTSKPGRIVVRDPAPTGDTVLDAALNVSSPTRVRQQLIQALVQQRTPDDRTAALIALLHALRCEHNIINPGGPRPVPAATALPCRGDRQGQLGIRGCPHGDPGDDRRGRGRRQLGRSRVRRGSKLKLAMPANAPV
jgi:hypothetical protein